MPSAFFMISAWFGAFVQGALEKGAKAAPRQKAARNLGTDVRHPVDNDTRLQLGAWIQQYGLDNLGVERWNEYRRRLVEDDDDDEKPLALPRYFWKNFVENEMRLHYSNRQRLRCFRALVFFVERTAKGENTRTTMLCGRRAKAKRAPGAEHNATKGRGIGHALLQFFVDNIQALRSRADSALLLEEAQKLRFHLLHQEGWPEKDYESRGCCILGSYVLRFIKNNV